MKTHLIKILEDHYDLVLAGTKTFEIRLNDRAYQKGWTYFRSKIKRRQDE